MYEACAVHRLERAAQLDADAGDFFGTERAALGELCCERAPFDELHPESRRTSDPLSAINADDIRVPDACHQATFFDHLRLGGVIVIDGTKNLEGDVAVEGRIPGTVYVAEPAASDVIQHAKSPPCVSEGRLTCGRR